MRHGVSSASRGSREENVRGAKLTEERTRGVPCSFNCKQGLQGRKRQGRQIDGRKGREMRHGVSSASRGSREENVRGAKLTEERTRGVPCSFNCKQGLQGRKRQGRQIDGRKGREMRHAVSSASRGSREENVRGAKLTEKRTRDAPCSFKCKQGLQG